MSKFIDGIVYMIVDDVDITTEFINYSTSTSKEVMPKKTVGGVVKRILETTEPVRSIYGAFTWYDKNTINSAWSALIED